MQKTSIKPEQIEEEIYLSIKDKIKSINGKELTDLIKEEITKRDYLTENWHIDYAAERIRKRIRSKKDVIKEKEVFNDKSNYHSIQTKTLLVLGFGMQILYFVTHISSNVFNILDKYGFPAFAGRILGEFIGIFFLPIIASLLISILLYYIRKHKSRMRYVEYFAITLFIISLLFIAMIYTGQRQMY